MRVGVPSEVKNSEYRVACTPAGVHELVRHGHEVLVQRGAGIGSSLPDAEFASAGAVLIDTRRRGLGRGRPDPQSQGARSRRSITGCARTWSSSPTCTWPRRSR